MPPSKRITSWQTFLRPKAQEAATFCAFCDLQMFWTRCLKAIRPQGDLALPQITEGNFYHLTFCGCRMPYKTHGLSTAPKTKYVFVPSGEKVLFPLSSA